MTALPKEFMGALKGILEQRYVSDLPDLLVDKGPEQNKNKQLSRAFSAFVLQHILDVPAHEAAKSVVDDFDDNGIDAIYYHEKTETLYLVQSKLKASESFKQEDVQAFVEGIRLLIKQKFDNFNANVQSRCLQIQAALDSCNHIKLVVAFTGDGISKHALEALERLTSDDDLQEERFDSQIITYNSENIIESLRSERACKQVNDQIKLKGYQKINEQREVYYGVAKLSDLAALHEKYGKDLYEKNIRYYLGSTQSNVNQSIRTTLGDNPQDFLFLNNGVTALSEIVDPKSTVAGYRNINVRGFSIINGAQTVATAAEYIKNNPKSDLSSAKVMLTIIKANAADDFSKKITKARNHQNPVLSAHFAALDDNQERLRQDVAIQGYAYHYRPGAISHSTNQIIKLDEAAKALALLENDPRFLVRLKSESARFVDKDTNEYKTIFTDDVRATQLINAVKIYREIRTVILANENSAAGWVKLTYRHGVFCIAGILLKRLSNRIKSSDVLTDKEIKDLISLPLDELRQQTLDIVDSHRILGGPLALFRNQGHTLPIINALMIKNYGHSANATVTNLRNVSKGTDKYPMQMLVDYLISQAPQI
ncbi:AIPR family protein [Methylobacter psychrophilus]|uniref:AIPR family protein n=1 Tax=Methylobacter psychrophilus TaxID=96941 RepID=UPI0021D4B4E0|nr:AIPR family protein [Methylobacter psychrophilus]